MLKMQASVRTDFIVLIIHRRGSPDILTKTVISFQSEIEAVTN
jgi:hypothetical protein